MNRLKRFTLPISVYVCLEQLRFCCRWLISEDQIPFGERIPSCRIPDDCIDKNRYPLFMARSVLRELIESLPSTRSL